MYCDSVVIHTISKNSGTPCAKLMILRYAVIKVVQIRLNEHSDVPNEACKERNLGVLGGNKAAYSGVKKCFWPRRGTPFRKNEVSVGFGFEFDLHVLVASLSKRVLMSCSMLDVSILSLTFGVLYFSLFFIGFVSIFGFAIDAEMV